MIKPTLRCPAIGQRKRFYGGAAGELLPKGDRGRAPGTSKRRSTNKSRASSIQKVKLHRSPSPKKNRAHLCGYESPVISGYTVAPEWKRITSALMLPEVRQGRRWLKHQTREVRAMYRRAVF
jgi:hypothetical protein